METLLNKTNDFFNECYKTSWMRGNDFDISYRQIQPIKYIGNMAYLYIKYDRPQTTREFFERYTSDKTELISVGKHGLTEQEWLKLAKQYYSYSTPKYNIPFEYYCQNLLYRQFYQTIEGHKKEEMILNYINKQYPSFTASTVDGVTDLEYGVDIEVKSNDNPIFYIQVKPITFLFGNTKKDLIQDRKNLFDKNNKLDNKVYIVYYKHNDNNDIELMTNNNNKILFNTNKFIKENGFSFFDIYDTNYTWKKL